MDVKLCLQNWASVSNVSLGHHRVWLHMGHGLLIEGFLGSASAQSITIYSHLWKGGSNNPWGAAL